jgi:hypothetical protein
MMILVALPLPADSSAPRQHARAWACGDRSWDTIQDYGHRCSVEIGNVHIEPGGLISGDLDGVLVVHRAIKEVAVARACEKTSGEKSFAK